MVVQGLGPGRGGRGQGPGRAGGQGEGSRPRSDGICVEVGKFPGDLRVELEELLQGVVGGEALDPVVGDPVLRPTLRTFDLRNGGLPEMTPPQSPVS